MFQKMKTFKDSSIEGLDTKVNNFMDSEECKEVIDVCFAGGVAYPSGATEYTCSVVYYTPERLQQLLDFQEEQRRINFEKQQEMLKKQMEEQQAMQQEGKPRRGCRISNKWRK